MSRHTTLRPHAPSGPCTHVFCFFITFPSIKVLGMKLAIAAILTTTAAITAPTAHAISDTVYEVGRDIEPGAYFYAVREAGKSASWRICATHNCDLRNDMWVSGPISESNRIGTLHVSPKAVTVWTENLALAPADAVMGR